jgi:UDP-N-acetyl-D-glucosamine dehydrogenase
VHVLGVAYKKDIDDVRESPALDIMMLLKRRGARLTFSDPHVPLLQLEGEALKSEDVGLAADADCTVIVTDHSTFNYRKIAEQAKLIVDTRNALKGISSSKIVRL